METEEKSKKKIELGWPGQRNLMIIALVVSVITAVATELPPMIKAVGLILAIAWGADVVRTITHYGLGTGVPSIGMLALGMGIVGAFAGMSMSGFFETGIGSYAGVLIGVALVAIGGFIYGWVTVKIIKMEIPVLMRGLAELCTVGALVVINASSILAGTWHIDAVLGSVVASGWIAIIFILSAMGMLHPYNACLGSEERRGRTLTLSVEIGAMLCIILGINMVFADPLDGSLLILVSLIIWIASYVSFVKACMKEAYETVGTGLIKTLG
jgi:tetrahydromethanopterin S-methyltransferase subunit C